MRPWVGRRPFNASGKWSICDFMMPVCGLILIIVLVIFLLGGFSGRIGGYGCGFGHGGAGLIGVILIVVLVLVFLGRL